MTMLIKTINYPNIISYNSKGSNISFIKDMEIKDSVLCNNNNMFLYNKRSMLSKSCPNSLKHNKKGFFLEILLHSLNYNAKRVHMDRPKYQMDLHKSQLFIFRETVKSEIRSYIFKRRILLFSFNRQLLSKLELSIKKLKIPNIYTGKGIFSKNDNYRIRKVKKKS